MELNIHFSLHRKDIHITRVFFVLLSALLLGFFVYKSNPVTIGNGANAAGKFKTITYGSGNTPCPTNGSPCVLGNSTPLSAPYQDVNSDVRVSGKLGVGGAIPAQTMELSTNNANDGIKINGSNNDNLYLFTNLGNGSYNAISQQGDRGIIAVGPSEGNPGGGIVLAPWSGTPSGLRIDSSGNVNVGALGFNTSLCLNGDCRTKWPPDIQSNNNLTLHLWAVQGVPCLQSGNAGPAGDGSGTKSLQSQGVSFPNQIDAVFSSSSPGTPNLKIVSNTASDQSIGFWNGNGGNSGFYCPPPGGIMLLLLGH